MNIILDNVLEDFARTAHKFPDLVSPASKSKPSSRFFIQSLSVRKLQIMTLYKKTKFPAFNVYSFSVFKFRLFFDFQSRTFQDQNHLVIFLYKLLSESFSSRTRSRKSENESIMPSIIVRDELGLSPTSSIYHSWIHHQESQ